MRVFGASWHNSGLLVLSRAVTIAVIITLFDFRGFDCHAQPVECHSRSQYGTHTLARNYTSLFPFVIGGTNIASIPLVSFPASSEVLPTANFPDGVGVATLLEARLSVNILCSLTAGFEGSGSWQVATNVTPTHQLSFYNVGLSHYGLGYLPTYSSNYPLPAVPVTTYDGITDFAGTSGFTVSNLSVDQYYRVMSGSSFSGWGYGPMNLSFYSDCYMSFLAPGLIFSSQFWQSTADYNWRLTYIYSTSNPQADDCNSDGISDSCDILLNNVPQTIVPGIPDSCQTDCDANGQYDSLQILADSTLDSSLEFGGDGKLDKCQGRVQWQEPAAPTKGIVDASISAYWVSGSDALPVFHAIPADPMSQSRLSDSRGKFIIPREYFSYPQQQGEIMRGIKASVTYAEDTGLPSLNMRTVTNYPGWDPLDPLRSGRFDRKIVFPAPVVFQPGVLGFVNGIDSSVSALRNFMSLDAAGSSPDQNVKRGVPIIGRRPIPSFLLYAMPSGPSPAWKNDGVSWGYINAPLNVTDGVVNNNVGRLNDFINDRVKPTLDAITEGGNAALVPLNIAAHSYGGIISRALLALRQPYPILNRYVSFDGVHGGSEFAGLFNQSNFFRERNINGTSPYDLTAPTIRGWNYSNFLATSTSHLFMSDSAGNIIAPDSSALGIGRTKSLSRFDRGPNGHCARFAGGWEMLIPEDNHSLQSLTREIITAARFFAEGGVPFIGSALDPGAQTSVADFSVDPMNSRYSTYGCGVVPPNDSTPFGELKVVLYLTATPINYIFQVDSFGLNHFEFDVSDSAATLEVTNNAGTTVFPKVNRVLTPNGSGSYTESFDIDVQGTGIRKLRFSSAVPAEAIGKITFLNKRFLTGYTDLQSYQQNSSVLVSAKMRGATGNVIAPNSGSINSTITAPDGTQTSLQLFDDGLHGDGAANNGTYANTFTGTSQPGFYQISHYASYIWAGWPIMRSAENSFEVRSNAATLSSTVTQQPVLNPQNGKTTQWRMGFTVNANMAGKYRLIGELTAPGLANIALDSVLTVAMTGSQSLSLMIPLHLLYNLPRTGLTLSNIRLVDPTRGQSLAERAPVTIQLPALTALDTLPPPVVTQVIPSHGPALLPGGVGNAVLLKGANFDSTFMVRVGGEKVKFQVFAGDTIQLTMPTGYRATNSRPIPVDIEVTTIGGVVNLIRAYTFTG